jgi:hypothetical protein
MTTIVDGTTGITFPSTIAGVSATQQYSGRVLQVVQSSYNTRIASSSTTYSDTGLSVSITPSSSSSKILVFGHQADCFKSNGASDNSIYLRLMRGASEILLFADRNLLTVSTIENMGSISFHYLDSPATTSATTYKTQFKNYSSASLVSVQQQSSSYSIIIAMEIAA